MSDNFCILPWTHICVRTDSGIQPCCRYLEDKPATTLDEIEKHGIDALNNKTFKKIREKMLSNEPIFECRKCALQEQSREISLRNSVNYRLKDVKSYGLDFDGVKYIELSLDNICNLECKMCDSRFSTKLARRDRFLNIPVSPKLQPQFTKFNNVDLSKLEYVKILGGEPMISPNFEKFIDYLLQKTDPQKVTVEFSTNGTAMPSKTLIEKSKQFSSFDITVSLDAFDRSNDYQRMGSSYLEVFQNALRLKQVLKNADLSFNCVVSILNANGLANTLKVLTDQHGFRVAVDFVRFHETALEHIPDSFAKWLLLKNLDHERTYKLLFKFLENRRYDEQQWRLFFINLRKLDSFYKTELKEFNLDLHDFLLANYAELYVGSSGSNADSPH